MKINFKYSRAVKPVAALIAASLLASACAQDASSRTDGRMSVVASFYPLAFVAERVGGDRMAVRNLTPPGAEPHDLELTPGQVEAVRRARLVVFLSGFQGAAESAVASGPRAQLLDVRAAARPLLGEHDPHVWLDPLRMSRIARAVANKLGAVDGRHAAEYRARAEAFASDLAALDSEFDDGLDTCRRREIVTSHDAFAYLADRYRLRQIAITGVDPEAEPTPRRLDEVVKAVRRYKATTVFAETLLPRKVAETVAREAGVRTDVLDPVEGVRGSDTYFTVMRRNLAALRRALECA